MNPTTVPDFLTVEEAARVLRIGRTVAYELARRYEATGGAEGIPVQRIGKQLRVPTGRLSEWAGRPIGAVPPTLRQAAPTTGEQPAPVARRRRPRAAGSDQSLLPFPVPQEGA